MTSTVQDTIENDLWIEIPSDSAGREFIDALHENMADAWASIEKRFVDDFLKGSNGIKIKTVELFDGLLTSSGRHRYSSLLRVVIDSWGKRRQGQRWWDGPLQDRFTIRPIRWMPATEIKDEIEIRSVRIDNHAAWEGSILNQHAGRESFPNADQWAVGAGERVAMVLHRDHIHKRSPATAEGRYPNLLLYMHWHADVRHSWWGGLLSISHASVSSHGHVEHAEPIDPAERELQKYIKRFQGARRSIRYDQQPAAVLNFTRAKPTKSANKKMSCAAAIPKK
jgi:hypothetical protein